LYKSLVRSHIEYFNSVWSTQYIENHKKIEKVQMRATKLIYELKGLPHRVQSRFAETLTRNPNPKPNPKP